MEKMLRWLTQGVQHLYPSRSARDPRPTFEHVDSARLGSSGFRASASMGLHDDFAETMPSYVLPPIRRVGAAGARIA